MILTTNDTTFYTKSLTTNKLIFTTNGMIDSTSNATIYDKRFFINGHEISVHDVHGNVITPIDETNSIEKDRILTGNAIIDCFDVT